MSTRTIHVDRIWGVSDIAREMKCTRGAVNQMRSRYTKERSDYPAFPDAICVVNDDQSLYDSEDVQAWFRVTGRLPLDPQFTYDHRGYIAGKKAS